MYKLLLIEDDSGIAESIEKLARGWDFDTRICDDFRRVVEIFTDFAPHIVLLDIGLPFFDGYHWCKELRARSDVPIVFISSASDNMNIVMAMNMGGDDFIAKPFDGQVLMAKLQAILRRSYDLAPEKKQLNCRGAILQQDDGSLLYRGRKLELSKNEYRVLLCLMEAPGKTVSREKLMQRLWETDCFVDDNTLTVNINRLRKKLDGIGLHDFIRTKFGVGYIVEETV